MKTKRLIGYFNGKPVYKIVDAEDIEKMFKKSLGSGKVLTGFTSDDIPIFGIPSHLRHTKS